MTLTILVHKIIRMRSSLSLFFSPSSRRSSFFESRCGGEEASMRRLPHRRKLAIAGMGVLLVAAGCQSPPRNGAQAQAGWRTAASSELKDAAQIPVAVTTSSSAPGNESAVLRPGLMISVRVIVAGKKEIEENAKQISDNGTIILPLLGTMPVAGQTLDSLAYLLVAMYKDYYVKPQVFVEFVRDANTEAVSPWGYVTVLGRVKNPGQIAIPATRDMTVSAAIQKAGGFSSSANTKAIRVTRHLGPGKNEAVEVNLHAVGAGGRTEDDTVIRSGDVVFVPELRF
jgi:protein involved in polysaccharide export with SLBB domain